VRVRYGFLTSTGTYSSELPDDLDRTPLASAAITVGGQPHSIQTTPTHDVVDLQRLLRRRNDLDQPAAGAQVYERTAEPSLLIPFWRVSWGAITTQTLVDPDGDQVVQQMLAGVRVTEDAHRVVRVQLGNGITSGNLREPIQRDTVRFIGSDESLWYSVEITDTQGLGTDGTQVTADLTFMTATLPFGISVTCIGPNERTDELKTLLDAIARSTTVVN
jgi:hypothetical protein